MEHYLSHAWKLDTIMRHLAFMSYALIVCLGEGEGWQKGEGGGGERGCGEEE